MKIYAKIIRNGEVLRSVEIGATRLTNDRISGRKYDELMRKAHTLRLPKQAYIRLTAENGKTSTFGGYPSPRPYVCFE